MSLANVCTHPIPYSMCKISSLEFRRKHQCYVLLDVRSVLQLA